MLFWGSWAIFLCPKMKFPCLAWFSTSADSFVFINLNCNPHPPLSTTITTNGWFQCSNLSQPLYPTCTVSTSWYFICFQFLKLYTHTHTHTPITATVSHIHEPRTFAHEPACIQRALNIMWICETNRLIFFFSFSGDYDSRKLTLGG